MSRPFTSIPIPETKPGLTKKQTAVAIIAQLLGITEEAVTDETELGEKWHQIAPVMAIKTDTVIISNAGMKAGDIFRQLKDH